jgi:hypothetical protein
MSNNKKGEDPTGEIFGSHGRSCWKVQSSFVKKNVQLETYVGQEDNSRASHVLTRNIVTGSYCSRHQCFSSKHAVLKTLFPTEVENGRIISVPKFRRLSQAKPLEVDHLQRLSGGNLLQTRIPYQISGRSRTSVKSNC